MTEYDVERVAKAGQRENWKVYPPAEKHGSWDIGFDAGPNSFVCIASVFSEHAAHLIVTAVKHFKEHPLARMVADDEELGLYDTDRPDENTRTALGAWQPIETAPLGSEDVGPPILVWTGYSFDVAYHAWDDADGKPVFFNGDAAINPTHWMPLPTPPSLGESDR